MSAVDSVLSSGSKTRSASREGRDDGVQQRLFAVDGKSLSPSVFKARPESLAPKAVNDGATLSASIGFSPVVSLSAHLHFASLRFESQAFLSTSDFAHIFELHPSPTSY